MTIASDLTTSRFNFALTYAQTMFTEAKKLLDNMATQQSFMTIGAADTSVDGTIVTQTLQSLMNAVPQLDPSVIAGIINVIKNGPWVLSPDIETAIWTRLYERDSQTLQDAVDKATNQWAKMNFNLPDGLLSGTILGLNTEYLNQTLDRSRDIAIKQAQMAMDNYFKAIQQAIEVERVNVAAFQAQVAVWLGEIERVEKDKDLTLKARIAQVEAQLKNLDIQSRILEWWYTQSFEKAKSIAALAAQVASGALAGASAQAAVGYYETFAIPASTGVAGT